MLSLYFRLQFQRSAKERGDANPSADSDDEDEDEEMDDMAVIPDASAHSLCVKDLGRLLHELEWMYVFEGSITQMLYQQVRDST